MTKEGPRKTTSLHSLGLSCKILLVVVLESMEEFLELQKRKRNSGNLVLRASLDGLSYTDYLFTLKM